MDSFTKSKSAPKAHETVARSGLSHSTCRPQREAVAWLTLSLSEMEAEKPSRCDRYGRGAWERGTVRRCLGLHRAGSALSHA
eukprot:394161-Rhodomonas_salina.1